MANLLLTILLVGAAVTYALELIDALLMGFFSKSTINKTLSLPLSVGGLWVMQQTWDISMVVTASSATFVSLLLSKYINKTGQIQYQRLPRL